SSVMSLRRTTSWMYSCGIMVSSLLSQRYCTVKSFALLQPSGTSVSFLQNVPLLRHKEFLKQADGELVAHARDVVGDGAVDPLVKGDLHVKGRHQRRVRAQPLVQFTD